MPTSFILRDDTIRARAIEFISGLNLKTPWAVTITPYRKNRSLAQNNTYHMWVGIIAQELGNRHDETHEALKEMFLPPIFVGMGDDKVIEVRRSTTRLNTKEMSEFMNQVEAWAGSELGIALPHPEDMAA